MHNTKDTGYLFLLILITLFFCVGASQQTQPPTQVTDKVIVYYFHGNYRCPSCMTIERYTRESVEVTFAKELKSGQIEFKSINVDLPANSHYVKDYKLYTKSVIISDVIQGQEQRWKNLQKVWELLRNEKDFKAYVKRETAAYLQGKHS
ncbi:MAG: nitrophenyl compound nitroreductase subunit ArsF family protein [Smithella sp.]|jgi:thiol-disulfide isomerase/thioredoxin|nr:nitrophenyl compound nitroreductase subunit ArsF family protein [Smithella sp.]